MRDTTDTQNIAAQLIQVEAELGASFLERAHEIRGLTLGLVSGQHVLMYGPPGTGKSALVRSFLSHIDNSLGFELLMTKFTAPESLEGPLDMQELMTGRYIRKRDGYLTHCDVAFLDEVFRSNAAALNTMLSIMNEGMYHEEGKRHPSKLSFIVGASNDLPDGDELNAFSDRFLLRYNTKYLTASSRAKLHRMPDTIYQPTTTITMTDVEVMRRMVKYVNFSDQINAQFDKLINLANDEGLIISDRAIRQSKRLIAANAVICGRGDAIDDDLDVMVNVLWKNPVDIPKAAQIVGSCLNPLKQKANEMLDDALSVYNKMRKLFAHPATGDAQREGFDANSKLGDVYTRIEESIANYGAGTPFDAALAKVQVMRNNLVMWLTGNTKKMVDL